MPVLLYFTMLINILKRITSNTIGALTVNTDVLPGAEQLKDIRNVINKKKVSVYSPNLSSIQI